MIGKNKSKKIINIVLLITIIFFANCTGDKKNISKQNDKIEILNIAGKDLLNQAIYYRENDSIDYSRSQFYEIYTEKCIKYYSTFDTLKNEIGVDRFIIYKTSELLKSDFSNIDEITLEEFFFKKKNLLCLDLKTLPNYGIIEDIVFLNTDSIINGEKSKRIKTIYQYINRDKNPEWIELENNFPSSSIKSQ